MAIETAKALIVEREQLVNPATGRITRDVSAYPYGARILEGAYEGVEFVLSNDAHPSVVGTVLLVSFYPDDQFATVPRY